MESRQQTAKQARNRTANFTRAETDILVNLVHKYKSIIENKKTDAISNKDKDDAWAKIEESFNSIGISAVFRGSKHLRSKYESIKKNTKKKSSLHRQEMYKTGGGTSDAPDFTPIEEKVLGMCSNIKGLDARYDSDTIPLPPIPSMQIMDFEKDDNFIESVSQEVEITNMEEIQEPKDDNSGIYDAAEHNFNTKSDKPIEANYSESDYKELQEVNKWERWNPKTLKTKVSKVLKANVTDKFDKLSSARLELVQMQINFAKEEHEMKVLHMINEEKRKQEVHELIKKRLEYDDSVALNIYSPVTKHP